MVLQISETLKPRIPYRGGEIAKQSLSTSGYKTHYDLITELIVENPTAAAITLAEDALARMVKSWRIEDEKGTVYWLCVDGRLCRYLNYLDHAGMVRMDHVASIAAGATVTLRGIFEVHFGTYVGDYFDISCVIPAEELSALSMSFLWGKAEDLGSASLAVKDGSFAEITEHRVALETGEVVTDIFPEGYNQPRAASVEKLIDAVMSDLRFEIGLPVGDVNYRNLVMVLDSAGKRSNAEISEIGYTDKKIAKTLMNLSWMAAQEEDRVRYALPETITGITMMDMADISGIPVGHDLSLYAKDQAVMGFSTAKTTGRILTLSQFYT